LSDGQTAHLPGLVGKAGEAAAGADTRSRTSVEPWTTVFSPGRLLGRRLVNREVDFAAFVFAQDDWTTTAPPASPSEHGQASPRDNVVFEAGLFGSALGLRRTFILHARGAKLPTDLLGLTVVRYGDSLTAAEMRNVNDKLRKAIEDQATSTGSRRLVAILAVGRTQREPSAVSLLRSRATGRATCSARPLGGGRPLSAKYWSGRRRSGRPSGIFYYWKGERPRDPDAPQLEGTGEILIESADRAAGYFTTRGPEVNARTSGEYWRAQPDDMSILEGGDDQQRAELIAERLAQWKAITSA
jgi:hypothetical protein